MEVMKKTFLALFLLLFASPMARAQFTFSTNGLDLTLVSYTGTNENVTIPNTTNGFLITSIGMNAFLNDYFLFSVTIPTNVTSIGVDAFENCPALNSVYCEGKPPTVASGAFMNAFLAKIYYLPGVSGWGSTLGGQPAAPQIGYATVSGAITITNYSVPDAFVTIPAIINSLPVVGIASNAFSHCATLTNLTIPASVTNIMEGAFQQCGLLTAISVDTNNPFYSSTNGVLLDINQDTLVEFPAGFLGSYTIPGSVTNISPGAFAGCAGLTNLVIPNTFYSIGTNAFLNCTSLQTLTMAGSITNISLFAFMNCVNLATLNISSNLTTIGNGAFWNCSSLTKISIPATVNSIGSGAFTECTNLTTVVIPAGVTNLGNGVFLECSNLVNVTILSTLLTNGPSEFEYCVRLTGIYVSGNAPSLGSSVFSSDNNLTIYYLPGTTGWTSSLGGRPTALWNPLIQASGSSFGVQNNQFGFNIIGTANIPIVVEACTNLANPIWFPLTTNTLTSGSFYFSEPAQTNTPGRYYRIGAPRVASLKKDTGDWPG
jgi:BspA type Leucine rich repeat region (6 copies)